LAITTYLGCGVILIKAIPTVGWVGGILSQLVILNLFEYSIMVPVKVTHRNIKTPIWIERNLEGILM